MSSVQIGDENDDHHGVLEKDFFENSDFHAVKVLASGGFGTVVLVEQKNDPSACFVMKQMYLFCPGELARAQEINERNKKTFLEETALMKQLDNKYLMPCWFALECPQYLAILMPYFPGGTLSDCLSVLNTRRMRLYSKQLTFALHYMHSQNVYHADIKPHNILMADDRIILSDFGLSGRVDSPDSKVVLNRGTRYYRAPESYSQEPINPFLADRFSLGVTIWCIIMKQTVGNLTFYEMLDRLDVSDCPGEGYWRILENLMSPEPELRPSLTQIMPAL